jgi:hypothetical protein
LVVAALAVRVSPVVHPISRQGSLPLDISLSCSAGPYSD